MFMLIAILLALIGVVFGIVYIKGALFLLRVILSLGFLGLSIFIGFFSAITLYARNLKYFIYTLPFLIPSLYAAYLSILWRNPLHILWIIIYLIVAGILAFLKISEPDVGIFERLLPAETLERRGKYFYAARKYEKRGDFLKAAEAYKKGGMIESAAYVYEKAGMFDKAAECYEILAEKEREYLKDASETWKKAGNLRKAAELLEKYAETEEWYLEDAAKLWEEVDKEKAKELWKKVAEYYEKEAKEEGVFYEDAAKAYEKIGNVEKAKEMYKKFIDYCREQAKYDKAWLKYVEEVEEKLKKL